MDLIDKKNQRPEKKLLFRWDYKPQLPIFLVLIFLLFLLLKSTVIDAVIVRGDSMNPMLYDGEVGLVNRLAFGIRNPLADSYFFLWQVPSLGDIVVFQKGNRQYIKEVIAGPGMEVSFHGDFIEIGNHILKVDSHVRGLMEGWETIPSDMVFVMGNNKKFSLDSRSFGPVSIENIRGKMLFLKL